MPGNKHMAIALTHAGLVGYMFVKRNFASFRQVIFLNAYSLFPQWNRGVSYGVHNVNFGSSFLTSNDPRNRINVKFWSKSDDFVKLYAQIFSVLNVRLMCPNFEIATYRARIIIASRGIRKQSTAPEIPYREISLILDIRSVFKAAEVTKNQMPKPRPNFKKKFFANNVFSC